MATLINEELLIETLGETHHLPLPQEYEIAYWKASVVGKNAQGKPYVQLLSSLVWREWRFVWAVMTDDELQGAQSAWTGLCSQICRFVDVNNVIFAATHHPDQESLEIAEVKIAGGHRWRVTMRMLKSNDAYEI